MRRHPIAFLSILLLIGCGHPSSLAGKDSPALSAHAAEALDPKFFARQDVQALRPGAFSQMPQALPMLDAIQRESQPRRQALIQVIRQEPDLLGDIRGFGRLGRDRQYAVLKRVFELECRVLGITPPEFALDSTMRGAAYFDFDLTKPGAGRVLLNPAELAKDPNPYAALLLLVHETRHSAQLQMTFDPRHGGENPAKGYRAAFEAQKTLSERLNFSEFCSLFNEYEAFQFANYVIGTLSDWEANTLDMGCFSSQYDGHGQLRIDLLALSRETGANGLLAAFNEGQKEQYRLLFKKP